MIKPPLDQSFKPAIIELNNFKNDVLKHPDKVKIKISIERENGFIYSREFDVFPLGVDDQRNAFIIERFIKATLWVVGGYKVYIHGSYKIYEDIASYYHKDGLRKFDCEFMSTVYEKPFEVIYVENILDMPIEKVNSLSLGGNLKGRRVGFDAGGSDIKISSVIDGEVVHSEEIIWLPKLNSDISYHYENIYLAMKKAIQHLGGKCDGIGISSAGVIINNKPMVSSLFIKIDKKDFELVKNVYINIVKRLSDELGYDIPFSVVNDGDVSALAGSLDLKDHSVMGIAMGTSEAVGYVDKNFNLTGWLNELAFVPVDYNLDALVDEWSLDFGVGCKYFSQDAVIKLAKAADIYLDDSLTLAEKLKVVQKLNEEGHLGAHKIFESIGVYLGYTLAYYLEFYEIKHVLLLGRVVSGKGGDTILKAAKKTLDEMFPMYSYVQISMPSEYMRRVGQSIAAASLTKNK